MSYNVTPSSSPHRGVDVARHGDVDQQQRPSLSLVVEHLRELLAADDRVRGGGGGDDDVGRCQLLGQPVEADDRAAEALREAARAVGVAIGDEDRAGSPVGERPRGELAGLTRPEDHDVTLAKVPEHSTASPTAAEGTLTWLEPMPVSERTRLPAVSAALQGGWRAARYSPPAAPPRSALDLPLDLGLPDDHRLQARGHTVELAGGVAVSRRVDLPRELGGIDAAWLGEHPSASSRARTPRPADDKVELGAVARAEHHRLPHLRRGDHPLGERAPLPTR